MTPSFVKWPICDILTNKTNPCLHFFCRNAINSRKRRARLPWTHVKKRRTLHYSCDLENLTFHTPPPYVREPSTLLGAPKKSARSRPTSARELDFNNLPANHMECNNTKKIPDNTSAFPNKSEYNELMGHLPSLLRTLREHNLLPDFMSLIRLIVSGKMSAAELPLLLLLEKARFCSLPSTNLMFYWPQTLKFWRVVYRLLKGKAIRLFSGPKSQGAILEGATNGACKPEGAELNFAVPNLTVLRTASGDEAPLPKAIKPGIVAEAVTIARKSKKDTCFAWMARR